MTQAVGEAPAVDAENEEGMTMKEVLRGKPVAYTENGTPIAQDVVREVWCSGDTKPLEDYPPDGAIFAMLQLDSRRMLDSRILLTGKIEWYGTPTYEQWQAAFNDLLRLEREDA